MKQWDASAAAWAEYKAAGFRDCPTIITGDSSSQNGWETLRASLQPILGATLNRNVSGAPTCPRVWNAFANPEIPGEV